MCRSVISLVVSMALCALSLRSGHGDAPATDAFTLDNGLRVFIHRIEGARGAFVLVHYTFGEESDPVGRSGLTELMRRLYTTCAAGSTPARTEDEVSKAYDGHHDAELGDDYSYFCHGVLADNLRGEITEAAARMADLHIEESDLARERANVRWSLGAGVTGPSRVSQARRLAEERLHPLSNGGRRGGIPEQVAAIRMAEVREQWRRFYKPANAILVVVGNLDPSLVKAGVRRQFGSIQAGERSVAPPPSEAAAAPPSEPLIVRVPPTHAGPPVACLALAGPPSASPRDIAAALVLASRLEGNAPRRPTPSAPFQRIAAALEFGGWLEGKGQRRSHSPELTRNLRDMLQTMNLGAAVEFQPLRNPAALFIFVYGDGDLPRDAAAIEPLRLRLRDAGSGTPTRDDLWRVRENSHGQPTPWPKDDEYPCIVALRIARCAQLEIDGAAVLAALDQVTPADLAVAAARPSVSVVILPETGP